MAAQASPLLSTKLKRPLVTADWIDRPRLSEQLNRSMQQSPLTLVCASAGFGKTTLVSSWIESMTANNSPPTPAAWLSLDASDSEVEIFLRYFVAAIHTVFPGSCPETLALLQAPSPTGQAPLVVALSNELDRLPARMVLVLDDYHALRGRSVSDFLSELLRHWPQSLHLVALNAAHTSPQAAGKVFGLVKPRMAGLWHTPMLAPPIVPMIFAELRTVYDGPVVQTQDMTVFNITKEAVVARQAQVLDQLPPIPGAQRAPFTPVMPPSPAWWAEALIPLD